MSTEAREKYVPASESILSNYPKEKEVITNNTVNNTKEKIINNVGKNYYSTLQKEKEIVNKPVKNLNGDITKLFPAQSQISAPISVNLGGITVNNKTDFIQEWNKVGESTWEQSIAEQLKYKNAITQ